VLPYFLRTRLQDRPELVAGLAQAHYELYTELLSFAVCWPVVTGVRAGGWGLRRG